MQEGKGQKCGGDDNIEGVAAVMAHSEVWKGFGTGRPDHKKRECQGEVPRSPLVPWEYGVTDGWVCILQSPAF